jgi:PelA/Pel-15E family pectate lyase
MPRLTSFLVATFLATTVFAQDAKPALAITAVSDFLALHLTGTAPQGTTALEYRFAAAGAIPEGAPWLGAPAHLEAQGAFSIDIPLEKSRWSKVQVRALRATQAFAEGEAHFAKREFTLLTDQRISALPPEQREAWMGYMKRSGDRFEAEFDTLAAECRKLKAAHSNPAPGNRAQFKPSEKDEHRIAGDEAAKLAAIIMSWQTPSGGWSKAVDYAAGARLPGTHWTAQAGLEGWHYCGTLDNRSTTEQIRFLAAVYTATKREDVKAAVLRGIEWLFAAQFPNGGWPQNYPVEPGYHEAITLNDDAMTHALELMLDVSRGGAPFDFADDALRQRARAAFDRGFACLAAAQVKVDGKPTAWCAQHDPLSLEPVGARKKEPPSLSGAESAVLLKFFMREAPVRADITAMIEPALGWLDAHRITGLRKGKNDAGRTDYLPDTASTEVYWARFYDVQTGRPLFFGADDGISYATFGEMAAKNRIGYDFYTTKPRDLLEKEVARWRKRIAAGK